MTDDAIRRLSEDEKADDELEEEWVRLTSDPEVRGVGANKWREEGVGWQVTVFVAEFLRDDPLEAEMRLAMGEALRAVPGVTDVYEEDREIWNVSGDPSGADLVQAAATVVDGLADRSRAYMDGLT